MEISIKFKEKTYHSNLNAGNFQEVINNLFEDCENIEQHQLCEKLCLLFRKIEKANMNEIVIEDEGKRRKREKEKIDKLEKERLEKEKIKQEKEQLVWNKFVSEGVLFTAVDNWENLKDEEIIKRFNNLEINSSKLFDFIDYSKGLERNYQNDLEEIKGFATTYSQIRNVSVEEIQYYIARECSSICQEKDYQSWLEGYWKDIHNPEEWMLQQIRLERATFLSEKLLEHLKLKKPLKEFKFLKKEVIDILK